MLCRLGPVARPCRTGLRAALGGLESSPLVLLRRNTSDASEPKVNPPKPKRKSRRNTITTISFDDLPAFKVDTEGKSVGPLEDLLELGKGYKEGELTPLLRV